MKKAFRKNIFRTIKKSLGRYMAILAIIALGVGFFAGIKISTPAMMKTGKTYVKEQEMYDYRLISTWGFDVEEIEQIEELDGVRLAEGAVWEDFIYMDETGTETCMKALSITEQVNKLTLVAGRLPEHANECVIDGYRYPESMIGQEIQISSTNSEETKDSFVYDTYTVTGLIRSPLYMNMERGTTTIGNGKIDGFIFIPLDGFDYEYYEEVYVNTDMTVEAFSEAYDTYIEDGAEPLEAEVLAVIDSRYKQEIADAKEEIADGEAELADAEAELVEGEAELADAKEELSDKSAEARQELAEAKQELLDGEQKLAEGKEELADAKTTLAEKEQELLDGESALTEGEAALTKGEEEYNKGLEEYKKGKEAYDKGIAEYNKGLEEYNEGLKEYNKGVKEYKDGKEAYDKGIAEYQAAKARLEEGRSQYEQAVAAKEQMEAAMPAEVLAQNPDYLALVEAVTIFESTEKTLEASNTQLAEAKAGLDQVKPELDNVKKGLDGSKKELDGVKKELDGAKKELDKAKKELDKAKKEIAENKKTIEENRQTLADGKVQLEQGRQGIATAEQEILDSEKTLEDGWKQYREGKEALERELAEAEEEIADAEAEIADGKIEIADAREEIADAKEELAEVEEPKVYVLDRSMNMGYASYESDVSIVEGIAKIFPIFFFLIAALVCSTTMTRMVDDERTQIGTLRALGYSEGAILFKYLTYSGSAAGTGAVLGYILGTRLFPLAIWTAYGMLYGFSDIVIIDDVTLLVLSLVVAFLCSAGTTFAACRLELSHAPAELIRPKAPSAGKRILLERITFLWKHLKFLYKVSARNIFRFKKRMIMMILGIAGCTSLVVAGFGVKDSISNIVNNQYDKIMRYHISANYDKSLSSDTVQEIEEHFAEEIANNTILMETSADASCTTGIKAVTLMVSDDSTIMESVNFQLEGTPVALPQKGEILIDKRLSELMEAEIGDTITLTVGEWETKPLKVSGIFENYTFYYAYVTGETYEEYFGEAFEPKTMYISLQDGVDHYKVASYLSDMKNASNISVVADMRNMVENMMQSVNYIVVLVIGCAAALAFIVLFNLGNINISERVREIATLKVLGFYPRETGAYVFRESVVLSVMGIVVGLPLGTILHSFIMQQIRVDVVTFEIIVKPMSYVYSVVAVLGFTIFVDLIMRRKINRINMAESLKSIE